MTIQFIGLVRESSESIGKPEVSTHLLEEEESKDGRIGCRQVGVAHLDPVAVCGWGVRTQRHCPIIPNGELKLRSCHYALHQFCP
ncbi:hypothetical protein CDAR_167701 [Caerostris darwini]|uniref:Uncharacterized protein n=1 Tax=Caerostris darwini TaxID=1538125 RepID=A0AAV4M8I7_9ARAC|nr:hypothetical protein CDAR_167701 [Caerostris darwini]